MKYYVYLIVTKRKNKLTSYVGYTNNLKKRIILHNSSKGAKFTRGNKWRLIYKKVYNNKTQALKKEFMLKNDRKKRDQLKRRYIQKNEN